MNTAENYENMKGSLRKLEKHTEYYLTFRREHVMTVACTIEDVEGTGVNFNEHRGKPREHERKFKKVGETYGIVSDLQNRACYDSSLYN
jgi:hypothetical protein